MEIEHALSFLGLPFSSTTSDLNTTFRKLAKKYHPDFNQGKENWAHTKMTELNLAYETALKYYTSTDNSTRAFQEKSTDITFVAKFNRAVNQVLQGIYIYYQYGLENVHLRKEGVRKFRYRDSIKEIKDGIAGLEALKPSIITNSQNENLNLFIDFSKAFLQNLLIEKYYIPSGETFENNAHKHYEKGSILLDYAIKDAFFGDRLIRIRSGTFYHKVSISYEEFLVVVTRYYKSSWVSETILKIYLLEVFTKVIRLLKKMRY